MTLPTDIELPAEYGIVVNNHTPQIDIEAEQETEKLLAPIQIKLSLFPSQRARLERLCIDAGLNLEDYVTKLVMDDLGTRVGRPLIAAASQYAGPKVSAPKGLVKRGSSYGD